MTKEFNRLVESLWDDPQVQALANKIGAENRAREAKSKGFSKEEALVQAKFLRRWSRGRPIIRRSSDATFWSIGNRAIKLTANEVRSLVKYGLAKVNGDPHQAGARLVVETVNSNRDVLLKHDYEVKSSKAVPGYIIGTHPSGWKVAGSAVDGEWAHYRSRSDKTTEGKGTRALDRHLMRHHGYT